MLHLLQALGLITSAPKLAALKIKDFHAPGAHAIRKWAWALMGKTPGSPQSLRVHIFIVDVGAHHATAEFEAGVVREAGESTAAMLGRLAAKADSRLSW